MLQGGDGDAARSMLVGLRDGALRAVAADGTISKLPGSPAWLGRPTTARGDAIYFVGRNRVTQLVRESNRTWRFRWTRSDMLPEPQLPATDPEFNDHIIASAATERGVVVLAAGGYLAELDLASGTERWQTVIGAVGNAKLFAAGGVLFALVKQGEEVRLLRVAPARAGAAVATRVYEIQRGWPTWAAHTDGVVVLAHGAAWSAYFVDDPAPRHGQVDDADPGGRAGNAGPTRVGGAGAMMAYALADVGGSARLVVVMGDRVEAWRLEAGQREAERVWRSVGIGRGPRGAFDPARVWVVGDLVFLEAGRQVSAFGLGERELAWRAPLLPEGCRLVAERVTEVGVALIAGGRGGVLELSQRWGGAAAGWSRIAADGDALRAVLCSDAGVLLFFECGLVFRAR